MQTYFCLIKVGRWLAQEHPGRADPASWDRELAVAWVGRVDQMLVGEFSRAPNTDYMRRRSGGQLLPRTKAHLMWSPRRFFNDIQEWEWIERKFDARRAFALPRSIRALIGPAPRVIADEVWAKLMWAGLNLTAEDLPLHANRGGTGTPWYPLELVRAITMMWLFSGLRTDEIMRLRLGAIRWQPPTEPGEGERVCLLDVPTNKTATAFTKPVDPLVGDAIEVWEQARPAHPNRVLAPLLCRKAGVPREDVRGAITGHRARRRSRRSSTTPRTRCRCSSCRRGSDTHRRSTQHYARITPTTLTKAYTDAGYFARNVRTIEVLLDRDAITTGRRPAAGRLSPMTSVTATAPTASSSNARTGWRAPAATSTSPSHRATRSCSKPRTGFSGCWSRSRSPRMSGPRSRATNTRSVAQRVENSPTRQVRHSPSRRQPIHGGRDRESQRTTLDHQQHRPRPRQHEPPRFVISFRWPLLGAR
jgi:hypothetical protein